MNHRQQRLGRAIAACIRGLDFAAQLTERAPLEAEAIAAELGKVPRVEVRHPLIRRGRHGWLVALVVLDPEPKVTYALPVYRDAIERAVRRVVSRRVAT